MTERWYVIKINEENKLNFGETQDYVTSFYYASLEDDVDMEIQSYLLHQAKNWQKIQIKC